MYSGLLIIGIPGSGKSTAVGIIETLLHGYGINVIHFDDKHYLENEVLRQVSPIATLTQGGENIRLGPHANLLKWETRGQFQIELLNGYCLNRAHEEEFRGIARFVPKRSPDQVFIAQYAYGPDGYTRTGQHPMAQSGTHFIHWMRQHNLIGQALVLDIIAPLAERAVRNLARTDTIPPDEFSAYFPDVVGFTAEEKAIFGETYLAIENHGTSPETKEIYSAQIEEICRSFIIPRMLEGRRHDEGGHLGGNLETY